MIEYYESILCPGNFLAALDDVTVADWNERQGRWIDRSLYRPVRLNLVKKIEWTGKPYDPATLVFPKQHRLVKETKYEVHPKDWE